MHLRPRGAVAPEGLRREGSAGAETLRLKNKKSSLPAPARGLSQCRGCCHDVSEPLVLGPCIHCRTLASFVGPRATAPPEDDAAAEGLPCSPLLACIASIRCPGL